MNFVVTFHQLYAGILPRFVKTRKMKSSLMKSAFSPTQPKGVQCVLTLTFSNFLIILLGKNA